MAQNEEVKRLLLKNRIVGFEYHWLFDEGSDDIEPYMIITYYTPDININDFGLFNAVDYIKHDSFEPGIKVGNEWWFPGDRLS